MFDDQFPCILPAEERPEDRLHDVLAVEAFDECRMDVLPSQMDQLL